MKISSDMGVYLHVPYCRSLCHYCDFAKTANWQKEHFEQYAKQLFEHTKIWLDVIPIEQSFSSLFVGGGTPSLFTHEYGPLFELLTPRMNENAEITLEANPDDLEKDRLSFWRDLGFNRISIGVQSFHEKALKFMHRTHDTSHAESAIALSRNYFDRVNVDLIYGWPGQSELNFRSDIEQAIQLGATHLSLYTLTYEPRTPIGRKMSRGMLMPESDDFLANLYDLACNTLKDFGFIHEEVSNWALSDQFAQHNALYWRDQSYLGVGVGAHGYLFGERYHYPSDDRSFIRKKTPNVPKNRDLETLEDAFGVCFEKERDEHLWLIEYVGSGLRSMYGIDISYAQSRSGKLFEPSKTLKSALANGHLTLEKSGILQLMPKEWFRESAWCLEVLNSFVDNK